MVMRWIRFTSLALVAVVGLSVPAAAQSEEVYVEDDLTEAGESFTGEPNDFVAFVFGAGGMTVSQINTGKGSYLQPAIPASLEDVFSSAIEVTVAPADKKTGVGVYCRRSPDQGGYLFYVRGKKWSIYGRDDFGDLEKLESGKAKNFKQTKSNTLRAECEKQSINGFAAILTFEINGKEMVSFLDSDAANIPGAPGLYVEGVDGPGTATFSDLVIEGVPEPTS
jgi:hypothetical protein